MSSTESEIKEEEKPKIEFNEHTYEAFEKEKLDVPHGVLAEKARYDEFRSKFKEEKAPLQIIIKSMHRRPIISYDEKGKAVKKDVLSYISEYHGKNWLGNDIWIRDHVDGVYHKPKFRTTMTQDMETGDYVSKKEYDGITEEYYIELTEKNRKKTIMDIIDKCNGTILENVKFYYHVPNNQKGTSFRCAIYTLDQFMNSSLTELEDLARKATSPVQYLIKDKKEYHG